MEIEKLIDRYFFALEKKIIAEIYNKQTREDLEKFIFKCNQEQLEFERRFNTICSTEYYDKQKLIFLINYISAEFEQREKLNY
ncbi:TPA: hypothetical protein MBF03_005705 [Klebsiella pneumoniae]|uniref:hypothetical protein n=1 Tax=Klebsiella pneumoniae TaxID=573 RepID=UPI0018A2AC6A|nr:hypothetical protein [Klebsiella pneumoniae]MBF7850183.1 hypothetical protein [Klebsiella pneumoniae]HBT3024237.1 hypothetical protein [Klebsiella pneumoniae]HCA6506484.1 hypothetical protein [Klebsiella pneumoniae]HDE3006750.1 hypothetical protein [Klebsiella pneumoniae]